MPTSTAPTHAVPESGLLWPLPPVRAVEPAEVARLAGASQRALVVLDDDPTGTQTISDLPVLTSWSADDLRWALRQNTPAFYVLTNTRSLAPESAAARNREVVDALVAVARAEGRPFALLSRGDSTLRGHFPLETDVLARSLVDHGCHAPDGLVLCPAYVDAGRITVDDVHWMRTADRMLPVAAGEFAKDATFGYRSSDLREFVEERSNGRWRADEVVSIGLTDIRVGGPGRVEDLLSALDGGRPAVVNAVCDDDLRVVALGALAAERSGKVLLYRTGPSFVRAMTGQTARPPLTQVAVDRPGASRHGLVVIGSHVSLTTRQLDRLRSEGGIREIELDVAELLAPERRDAHVATVAEEAVACLDRADAVVRTSRRLVTGADPAESLAIARHVSKALVDVVAAVAGRRTPRFVVAKGGITSSDVATDGLGMRRAWVRGTLLPGIVSLWSPVGGVATGIPYVVFAGNVGDDDSLARVVRTLREDR